MNSEVTEILGAIEQGDEQAAAQLLPLVYNELRRLAARKLAHEAVDQTLQPTALVHEAFLRLVGGQTSPHWENRSHFFAAAAQSMRRILIDAARRRRADKRGGAFQRIELSDDVAVVQPTDSETMLALDDALTKLSDQSPEIAKLVELRYFTGLTVEQTAELLDISTRTVKRNWAYARAWLRREMDGDASGCNVRGPN